MTDKITKLIAKMPHKDSLRVKSVIEKINKKDFRDLDIKAMKNQKNIFRVRIGNYRIIFLYSDQETNILLVDSGATILIKIFR